MNIEAAWYTLKMTMNEFIISHIGFKFKICSDREKKRLKTLHLVRENEAI